jgi:hypothetical protein
MITRVSSDRRRLGKEDGRPVILTERESWLQPNRRGLDRLIERMVTRSLVRHAL